MIKEIIAAMVAFAISCLGLPYSYGHTGPNSYDCSGLVYRCYLDYADIELPYSAYKIGYSDYLTIETIEELILGDIVCFNTNLHDGDLSDHNGIFLGEYEDYEGIVFIHASSGQGEVVISRMDEGYYFERFSWGKRILTE